MMSPIQFVLMLLRTTMENNKIFRMTNWAWLNEWNFECESKVFCACNRRSIGICK